MLAQAQRDGRYPCLADQVTTPSSQIRQHGPPRLNFLLEWH